MGNNHDWSGIAKGAGFDTDKSMLKYYYEEQGMGSRLIGSIIKVSRFAVLHRARKLGIKVKARGGRNNLNPKTDKFEKDILEMDKLELLTMTSEEIMRKFNIPKFIFYKITVKHNINYDRHGRFRK